jgi:hypothetical protein
MATDFVNAQDFDQLAFVRFWGGTARGVLFEFGTVSQFERVTAALRTGADVLPLGQRLDGDPVTADDLDRLLVAGQVTFGQFPVTVEVGSGNLFNFTVED